MKRDIVGRNPAMSLSVSGRVHVPETHDEQFMRVCLRLAARARGYVSPNPMVGAVLVQDDKVVATGYHRRFGGPHAEVECLRTYDGDASDTTLYVNLEPCAHYGKTPPCVDLILQRGIRRVVVAMSDPNPLVAGKALRLLRRRGVEVKLGVLQHEAEELNRFFIKHITTGLPYVHMKIAQTLDGYIGKRNAKTGYITSKQSLTMVHRWRAEYDAVLVGANTIKSDNPRLTVRLVRGRDPAVVIVDGRFSLTGNERVFASASRRAVYLCTTRRAAMKHAKKGLFLQARGVRMLAFRSTNDRLNLRNVLRALYRQGIGSILVEGGRDIFSQCIQQNLVDELTVFTSSKHFHRGVTALSIPAREKLERWMARRAFRSSIVGGDHVVTGRIL